MGLHNLTGMGAKPASPPETNHRAHRPLQPSLRSPSLDLSVCHSSSRCSCSFLPSRVSYNTPSADCRSFLICARVSHPDRPAHPHSLSCLTFVRQAEHLISGPSGPQSLLDHLPFTNNTPKTQASHFITDSLHRLHLHLHRIASHCMVLRPTSTRPSIYRTLAHPPASGFQTLRPLVPHDPINHHGRTLFLPRCTTNRHSPCFAPCGRSSSSTCPPVSAVGLAPGPRAARSSFCHPLRPSTIRLVGAQIWPSRTV